MMPWLEAFHRPTSIPEALRLVQKAGRRGAFVAGATDIQVQLNRSVRILVDTTALKLAYVKRSNAGYVIGAATTLEEIVQSKELQELAGGILSQAAAATASVQIRNMATIGGKLASASPAAELIPALLVLDAEAVTVGRHGRRHIPLGGLFSGYRETVLNGDLLTEIVIPRLPRGVAGCSFQRLARVENDVSIVSVAAGLSLDAAGNCRWVRIAAGGVAPVAIRLTAAEEMLRGERIDEAAIETASRRDAGAPYSDTRATAAYRREMVRVLVGRALRECAGKIGANR